jgi:hypothetical protein
MPSVITTKSRIGLDHFEPEAALNPQEARHLRGYLEEIDYTAFEANQKTLKDTLGQANHAQFEQLAAAAAKARARWVGAALKLTEGGHPSPEDTAVLAKLRQGYDELSEAYDGLRRMVERGYLKYQPKA